jgi:hypothetical protein
MIDLNILRQEIINLTPRKKLFKVLKEELSVLGYWKNQRRGNPKRGYTTMKEKNVG